MKQIDLQRYMGSWNVIANIPTFYEKNAFNPVEGYQLQSSGTIFNFYDSNRGSFQGPRKRITAKAWVVDAESNAMWKVQFIWPLRFSYQILEVGEQYEYSVVGHPSKRYVWIMAREKSLDERLLQQIMGRLKSQGYKIEKIKKVPQRDQIQVA